MILLRAVTLVGEADRKMLKAAIKHGVGEDQVRHRIIPVEIVSKWAEKLEELKDDISGVLRDEKEEKQVSEQEPPVVNIFSECISFEKRKWS